MSGSIHPSRRAQQPAEPVYKVTFTTHHISQYPSPVKPLVIGERPFFHQIRVGAIQAMQRARQYPFMAHWLDDKNNIVWANLSRIFDVEQMSALVSSQMIGLYWLVNHDDQSGLLSSGQIYDLWVSLTQLGVPDRWPDRLHRDMVAFLKECLDKSVIIEFTLTPVQQRVNVEAVGAALAQLAPQVKQAREYLHEPYDPSAP